MDIMFQRKIVTHLTHDLPWSKELVLLVFGENHGSELRCPEIARESDLPFSIVYHLLETFLCDVLLMCWGSTRFNQ